jgi:hypothetical protein
MKRVLALLPVLLAFQVGVSPALAWTWPVSGPVLQPFSFNPDDPYAGGHHRGIDIGAPAGTAVVAPAAGTVSFAGTVPGGGLTVAVRTPDGYSVTLVHLGAIAVARGASVSEGGVVGSVGPSGEPEHPEPYVHLGIRIAADPQGYVDPFSLLPASAAPPPPAAGEANEAAPTAEAAAADASENRQAGGQGRAGAAAGPTARAAARAQTPGGRAPAHHVRTERVHSPTKPPAVPQSSARARAAHALAAERTLGLVGPADGPGASARPGPRGSQGLLPAALLVGAIVAAAGLFARRQLRDADGGDHPATVLPQVAASSAEHAEELRLGQEDDVVSHGDLERILLAQAKMLPDLDRDDYAAELVDVANDPRCRLGLRRPGPRRRSRFHRRQTPLSARLLQ